VAPTGTKSPKHLVAGGNTPTGSSGLKDDPLVLVGGSNSDKKDFSPGWWFQPKQKDSSRISFKGTHSIQNHMYCVGGVVNKLWTRPKVLVLLGLNNPGL